MSEVDGSIYDRLITMDVPQAVSDCLRAIDATGPHPIMGVLTEYMTDVAQIAFEAGQMQAEFDVAFERAAGPAPVMPEIADRGCSFIDNDSGDAGGEA